MIRPARPLTVGAALLLCALAAGCGGKQASPGHPSGGTSSAGGHGARRATAGRPASDAQVLMLARVLESNREHGGARFTATLKVDGQTALANGRVDFRSGRGTALVRPARAGLGPPRRYFWTRRVVFAQASPGGRRYDREVPNEQGNPVHAMIGFINLLAADTIDNTTAIESQSPRVIGPTTIAGTPVQEFTYGRGGAIKLWIARGSGLLRQIASSRVPGGITVDLLNHKPVKIDLPPAKASH